MAQPADGQREAGDRERDRQREQRDEEPAVAGWQLADGERAGRPVVGVAPAAVEDGGQEVVERVLARDERDIEACERRAARALRRRGRGGDVAGELLTLLERIHADDRETGFVRVVSEMVAGSVANPALGPRMVELVEPWIAAAQTAAERVLAPTGLGSVVSARQLAFAAVTFYLGANLLTQLVPDSRNVEEILATGRRLAPLLDAGGGALLRPPNAT